MVFNFIYRTEQLAFALLHGKINLSNIDAIHLSIYKTVTSM
jgi:hypothetical protein